MKEQLSAPASRYIIPVLALLVVLSVSFSLASYFQAETLSQDLTETKRQLASTTEETRMRFQNLDSNFAQVNDRSFNLSSALQLEQDKSGSFAKKIDEISSTVGALDKLSKTDKELLQKYSKVYFLNENYVPLNLVKIPAQYLTKKDATFEFHTNAWPFLKQLLDSAAGANLPILVVSAFRSFGTQATLKASYRLNYGSGTANQFSAEQGYSEHQLGTTIDLTTPAIGDTLAGFDKTSAYEWLNNNAHKYGFVLSYPKNNTFYQFEPWHWRFVGVELATKLHYDNKYFYDFDQRVIDAYLVKIFD